MRAQHYSLKLTSENVSWAVGRCLRKSREQKRDESSFAWRHWHARVQSPRTVAIVWNREAFDDPKRRSCTLSPAKSRGVMQSREGDLWSASHSWPTQCISFIKTAPIPLKLINSNEVKKKSSRFIRTLICLIIIRKTLKSNLN